VLYAGDNDVGEGWPEERILQNYQTIAKKVDQNLDCPLTLVTIKPSPARWDDIDKIKRINSFLGDFAGKEPNIDFINIFDAMIMDGRVNPDLFLEDELHMSEAGYEIWTGIFRGYFDRIL
jgi:lysophospholipase L1-like esterase